MGDEQRGDALGELHPADLVAQLHPDLGVERRQRLVEQQHRRRDGERPGQRHPLLLAAGQLVRVAAAAVAQPDQLQQLAGPPRALGLRRPRIRSPNATFSAAVMVGNRL